MEKVVKFVSFQEAEESDNIYWANTTAEQRLNCLISLRSTFFDETKEDKIEMVAFKKSLYEEGVEP